MVSAVAPEIGLLRVRARATGTQGEPVKRMRCGIIEQKPRSEVTAQRAR